MLFRPSMPSEVPGDAASYLNASPAGTDRGRRRARSSTKGHSSSHHPESIEACSPCCLGSSQAHPPALGPGPQGGNTESRAARLEQGSAPGWPHPRAPASFLKPESGRERPLQRGPGPSAPAGGALGLGPWGWQPPAPRLHGVIPPKIPPRHLVSPLTRSFHKHTNEVLFLASLKNK